MKQLHKLFGLILCLFLILSFCGCGKNAASNNEKAVAHSGVIPKGGIYTDRDGNIYKGDGETVSFPKEIKNFDSYTFEDYVYTYYSSDLGLSMGNGWAVEVAVKSKESYSDPLCGIADIPVAFFNNTYSGCASLKVAPLIPASATHMNYTFSDCTSLKGEVTVNANPISYEGCFSKVKGVKIIGEGSKETKKALASTGKNITY